MSRLLLCILCVSSLFLSGCVTSPPTRVNDICHMLEEKDWYDDAKSSYDRWGSPIPVMMAMMHQESRFRAKAKPPRTKILWIIPGPRKSSAYGYSQAKDDTWDYYIKKSGNWGADRDDFADAIDFVGWYNSVSHKRNKIALSDTYHLYLAYHEGNGGYERRTFRKKKWLLGVAKKVSSQAWRYKKQLKGCEKRLQSSWWWPF